MDPGSFTIGNGPDNAMTNILPYSIKSNDQNQFNIKYTVDGFFLIRVGKKGRGEREKTKS
jgi:hypothetical protein